jgi:hypothetical protein
MSSCLVHRFSINALCSEESLRSLSNRSRMHDATRLLREEHWANTRMMGFKMSNLITLRSLSNRSRMHDATRLLREEHWANTRMMGFKMSNLITLVS